MREWSKNQVYKNLLSLVGRDNIESGDSTVPSRSLVPAAEKQKPPNFMVRPGCLKEVQKIVRLANRHRVPLIPRSSRESFSSLFLPEQGGILIDLSRMNRILNIDTRNHAARIEPGVTWGQLQNELAKHGLRVVMPLLPRSDKSALACLVEREPGLIPRFEYSEPILTMEVVLPNGDVFRTGSASGPASLKKTKAGLVGPYGPSAMDLFRLFQGAQGTLGIVTWVNVKVEHKPVKQKLFFIPFKTLDDAVKPLYGIQHRMMGYECFAINNQHLAAIVSDEAPGGMEKARENLPAWTVILCLGGGKRYPEKKIEYEEQALREIAAESGFDLLESLAGLDSSFIQKLQAPWNGAPYFKHRLKGSSLDIYFITTLNKAPVCSSVFHELAEEHGRNREETGIYIQPLEYARACHVEFSIPFDPESAEEVESVSALARDAVGVIASHGGFFSRPHRVWSENICQDFPLHMEAVKKLKDILDPKNILNPGALCP
jgi:FAD/FMN-containing dehydrogenase